MKVAAIEFLENDRPLPSIGLAFIYCYHKENQVQSLEYCLGAIVRQLVEQRPAILQEVRSLHEKHRGKKTKATCREHVELLQSLAHECSEVYVAIDMSILIDYFLYIILHIFNNFDKEGLEEVNFIHLLRDF